MSEVDNSAALENTPAVVPGIVDPAAAIDPGASATPEATEETPPADASEEPPAGKPSAAIQKAINRLTRRAGDAERRAIRAEARAEALESVRTQPTPPPSGSGEPKVTDFADYNDYSRALARYEGRAAAKEELATTQRDNAERSSDEKWQAKKQAFEKEAETQAKAAGIDFEEAWETLLALPKEDVSPAVATYLYDAAKNKAVMVDFLANNPDEMARISRLNPVLAVQELTLVEARLGAKTPARRSTAPAPVPTVGATSAATSNVERMSHADLLKLTQKWSRN